MEPTAGNMYEVGTIGTLVAMARVPDGTIKAEIEGKRRARVKRFVLDEDFFKAEAEEMEEKDTPTNGFESLIKSVISGFARENVKPGAGAALTVTPAGNLSTFADRIAGI